MSKTQALVCIQEFLTLIEHVDLALDDDKGWVTFLTGSLLFTTVHGHLRRVSVSVIETVGVEITIVSILRGSPIDFGSNQSLIRSFTQFMLNAEKKLS